MSQERIHLSVCSTKRFLEILDRLAPTPPLKSITIHFNAVDAARLLKMCHASGLEPEQIVRGLLLDYTQAAQYEYRIPKKVPPPTTKRLAKLLEQKSSEF